jgi:hypothetical protein
MRKKEREHKKEWKTEERKTREGKNLEYVFPWIEINEGKKHDRRERRKKERKMEGERKAKK